MAQHARPPIGSLPRRPLIVELDSQLSQDSDGSIDLSRANECNTAPHGAARHHAPLHDAFAAAAANGSDRQTARSAADHAVGSSHAPAAKPGSHQQDTALGDAIAALGAVPSPGEDVFFGPTGDFDVNDAAAARHHWQQSAAALRHLAAALPRLSTAHVDWGPDPVAGAVAPHSGRLCSGSPTVPQQRQAVLIEDVTERPHEPPAPLQLQAAAVLRAWALHVPEPPLGGDWATAETGGAAAAVLAGLAALAPGLKPSGAPEPVPVPDCLFSEGHAVATSLARGA